MECVNLIPFDKTIQITVNKLYLDEKCQHFSQLNFFQQEEAQSKTQAKGKCQAEEEEEEDKTNYLFLSHDRLSIFVYTDLSVNSDKPINCMEFDFPLNDI